LIERGAELDASRGFKVVFGMPIFFLFDRGCSSMSDVFGPDLGLAE
jgi:hypothetical protein